MKGLVAVLLALVLAGLAAWYFFAASESAPPAEMTDAEVAQIEAEVNQALDEWWAVWSAAEDYDQFVTIYADDPDVHWVSDGVPSFGRGEMDANFRPVMENMQRQENAPVEWRTFVITPDVAYTVRINDVTQIDLAGNAGPSVRYAETLVWVKRDGEWKVLFGHGSTPNEPM
ncbi:MAG: SgcJ/EcaC family oxidoreductase [Gemmatimonadota bacterium]|jgi:uncharacterized protein (TIGR02246 family)